jgi:hypothetical protein
VQALCQPDVDFPLVLVAGLGHVDLTGAARLQMRRRNTPTLHAGSTSNTDKDKDTTNDENDEFQQSSLSSVFHDVLLRMALVSECRKPVTFRPALARPQHGYPYEARGSIRSRW